MEILADAYGAAANFAVPFKEALKEVKSGDTLVFQKKEYHFYKDYCESRVIHMTNTDSFKNPQKYFAMLLENFENITVDGNGAVFVIHGDICSLALLNCRNVKLKNFTIQYHSPSNTEMIVTAVKGNTVTYRIPATTLWYLDGKDVVFFEQSPFTKKNYWQFKNDENSWCGVCHFGERVFRNNHSKGPFFGVKAAERLSMTEVKLQYHYPRRFKVGDVFTFSQNKNRNTCGVFVNECADIAAENIEVNYLQGFGWLSQMCENVSFKNVTFRPDSAHHVSAFADLIHVCGCKGNVAIQDCYFAHPHDDAINIHGAFLRVKEKKDDRTAVFEFVHDQQGGYRAFHEGNRVRLYRRYDLSELDGVYTVVKAVDDIDAKTVTVQFAQDLPKELEEEYEGERNIVAENITYCPNVEIAGCEFRAIPTRGILCTTCGTVRIHDNLFENLTMPHIFISNDAADWYESGPVRDVEIYRNRFYVNKKNNAILIRPIVSSGWTDEPIHENIKIYENEFHCKKAVVLDARNVKGLSYFDNAFYGVCKTKVTDCEVIDNT